MSHVCKSVPVSFNAVQQMIWAQKQTAENMFSDRNAKTCQLNQHIFVCRLIAATSMQCCFTYQRGVHAGASIIAESFRSYIRLLNAETRQQDIQHRSN
jgi:hypothetical protein